MTGGVLNVGATTSVVFNPCPVTQMTTQSSLPNRPCSASFFVTPTVTPPAEAEEVTPPGNESWAVSLAITVSCLA